MATELATGYISLAISTKGMGRDISRQFSGVEKQADTSGKKAGKRFGGAFGGLAMAGVGAAAVGVGIAAAKAGGLLKDSIMRASDLGETQSKVNQIFGKQGTAALERFAKGSAKSMGQTKQSVLNAASTFGTFGKAAGLSGKDLANFSSGFVTLSSDMASFFNTSPEEAIEAIGAGLRGESEPLRKYGVLLDDASMRQEALRLGLIKTTKQALTPQQKVLAAQALIYKQTKDAQGDFAKTSGGLANQQRILTAQWTEAKTQLGGALLPISVKFVTFLNNNFQPAVKKVTGVFGELKNGWAGLVAGFKFGSGEITSAANSLGGIGERIGAFFHKVGPALTPVLTVIRNMLPALKPLIPQFVALGRIVGGALIKILPIVGAAFATIGRALGTGLAIILPKIAAGFTAMSSSGGFIRSQLIPALMGIVDAGAGLARVVLPIIKQIAAAFIKEWPKIKATVVPIFKTVGEIVVTVMGIIGQAIRIGTHLIKVLWEKNGAGIIKSVKGVFGGLGKIIGGALKIVLGVVQVFHGLLTGDFKKAGQGLKSIFTGNKNILIGIWKVIKSTIVALVGTLIKELFAKFKSFVTWQATTLKSNLAKLTDLFLAPVRLVRDKLKSILDQVANRFRSGVTAIGKAWDGLKEKAKAPVRFIINTVINGGLIRAFNAIASKVGAPRLSPVPSFATGGVLPGYTPGRDVHRFYSATGGRLDLSGGEPVMRPEFGKAVGRGWVDKANKIARTRGVEGVRGWLEGPRQFARGGIVGSFAGGGIVDKITKTTKTVKDFIITTITKLVPMGGVLKAALGKISMAGAGSTAFGDLAKGVGGKVKDALYQKGKDWVQKIVQTIKKKIPAGDPGGPAGTGSRARVNWKGGTFTERFRNTLLRAQGFAGRNIPVTQGGFSRRVRASGTSHYGDAIDTVWNSAILRGLRRARVAAWHRSPSQGPWGHHIHGVPLPGAGYAGGSGIWQAQDYLRGGNGLKSGGFIALRKYDQGGYLPPRSLTLAHNATGQRERLLSPSETRAYEGGPLFGGPVTIQGYTAEEIARRIEAARRRREALQPVMA